MSIRADAPSVFEAGPQLAGELEGDHEYDEAYEENGYSYGADPIPVAPQPKQIEYQTPAPKSLNNGNRDTIIYELDGRDHRSTDKKRKRHHVEELDINAIRASQERDEAMPDAPRVLHSGLTGGLNRLLSKSKFPPSPEYSGNEPGSLSRSKTIIAKERGRNGSTALVKVRKAASSSRRTSDESRPRKHHRSSHHHSNGERDHSEHRPKRTLKSIEYHHPMEQRNDSQQLVVYRTRAELFLSFVTKGPESVTGCSMNKALKRYHREREEQNLGLGKAEEEKELWKSLRLKKNERGEIVVII